MDKYFFISSIFEHSSVFSNFLQSFLGKSLRYALILSPLVIPTLVFSADRSRSHVALPKDQRDEFEQYLQSLEQSLDIATRRESRSICLGDSEIDSVARNADANPQLIAELTEILETLNDSYYRNRVSGLNKLRILLYESSDRSHSMQAYAYLKRELRSQKGSQFNTEQRFAIARLINACPELSDGYQRCKIESSKPSSLNPELSDQAKPQYPYFEIGRFYTHHYNSVAATCSSLIRSHIEEERAQFDFIKSVIARGRSTNFSLYISELNAEQIFWTAAPRKIIADCCIKTNPTHENEFVFKNEAKYKVVGRWYIDTAQTREFCQELNSSDPHYQRAIQITFRGMNDRDPKDVAPWCRYNLSDQQTRRWLWFDPEADWR